MCSPSSDFIPEGALGPNASVFRHFPSHVVVGDAIDVRIGNIFDPSKFWINNTFGELDRLMKNLQIFFEENHAQYLIPQWLLKKGLHCVALYAGKYHRCVIVDLLPEVVAPIRVLHIDYGKVQDVEPNEIWFLPKKFANLPCQAQRARLANIYPLYEHQPWSNAAVARFKSLIANKVLVAEIESIDEEDEVLVVYLADVTDKNNKFYINNLLVTEGYAVYWGQARKTFPANHVGHPEFDEMETGAAPTIDEMQYIIDNESSQHQHMAKYFDIRYHKERIYLQNEHKQFNQKRMERMDDLQAQRPTCQTAIHIESGGDYANLAKDSNNAVFKLKISRLDTGDVGNNPELESFKKISFVEQRQPKPLGQNYTDEEDKITTNISCDNGPNFTLKKSGPDTGDVGTNPEPQSFKTYSFAKERRDKLLSENYTDNLNDKIHLEY